MNVLLGLAKERKINGYDDSITKAKKKRKSKCTISYAKGKGIFIIVWAAPWGGSRDESLSISSPCC